MGADVGAGADVVVGAFGVLFTELTGVSVGELSGRSVAAAVVCAESALPALSHPATAAATTIVPRNTHAERPRRRAHVARKVLTGISRPLLSRRIDPGGTAAPVVTRGIVVRHTVLGKARMYRPS